MELRDYIPEDAAALKEMHKAQGFDYELPNLDNPLLWITRKVLVNGDGKPVQALLGRLTSEAYFLEGRPEENHVKRLRNFLLLEDSAREAGRRAGLDSVHVWLPEEIQKTFGNQLERLGWKQYLWASYARQL